MTSRITIFEQGNIENKRVLLVPLNATLDSLIKQAAKELKVVLPKKGAKLFFKNGSVVDEVELVRPNDVLFLCANASTKDVSSRQCVLSHEIVEIISNILPVASTMDNNGLTLIECTPDVVGLYRN